MFNIALNTFRELARNKILYMILFFGIVFIVFSLALASLSLGQTDKIVVDFGLAMIEMFGLISVIFVGSQLLFREIEGKTIYLILSKPSPRRNFILGKFLGFSAILFFVVLFQSVLFTIVALVAKTPLSFLIFASIGAIYLKLLLLFAIILFFSTFISPLLSILLTVGIYWIGHGLSSIVDIANHSHNFTLYWIGRILMIVFPNFEALNLKALIGTTVSLNPISSILVVSHAIVYLGLLLLFSVMIFNRKTFEN